MIDWYAQRDDISRLIALVALGLVLSPLLKYRPNAKNPPPQELFAVQMVAPPEVAEPPPVPTPVLTPALQPRQQPTPVRPQNPVTAPDVPASTEEVVMANAPPPPHAELVPVRPVTPAPAAPPLIHTASLEESYVASVRSYLIGIKRYPTGRDASIQRPRGKTRVWFVLGRDGRLLNCGIDDSSDSLLLDRTALATVQRGGFPPFPDTAWSGQGSHRFTVELEFIPSS